MLISDILKRVNKLVSNSSSFKLTYNQVEQYIDNAVDHINCVLKTNILTPMEEWADLSDVEKLVTSKYYIGCFDNDNIPDVKIGYVYYNTTTGDMMFGTEFEEEYVWEIITENQTQTLLSTASINYFDYNEMSEDVIRSVLIYYVAASYLEEEDEFEAQHNTYAVKADEALTNILHMQYCVYDTPPQGWW